MKKILKVISILIIIALIAFSIHVIRNMIILNSLAEKVQELEKNNNIYGEIISNSSSVEKQTVKMYFKDNVLKQEIETQTKDGKVLGITQITYPNERKFFVDNGNEITVQTYEEESNINNTTIIMNYAECVAFSEKVVNSIVANIKTEKIDGKECYIIRGLYNGNIMYEAGTEKVVVYIEKETGLPLKRLDIAKENEYVTTYEYKFDVVTNEDMKEPE